MVFLPIARREVRVAATRRGTMWLRLAGAIAALVIGGLGFLVQMGNSVTAMVGRSLFGMLTLLACFTALTAGLIFTSDSLSEEKREGTLGFLFLTDLRGYDVVSGKLLAAALRGFYVLLAAFPIVAVTLLMGGVTGTAFWKACLALINSLFASLVAGVFVSSISRQSQKALLGTVLLLSLWSAGGYVIDALASKVFFRFSSPFFVFMRASRSGFFWEALLVNQVIVWLLFAASSHFAARTWHDKPGRTGSAFARFSLWLKYGSARRRANLRQKLMSASPITWLVSRERWQASAFWVLTAILMGFLIITVLTRAQDREQFWPVIAGGTALILYLGFASQACRFFVDARRNMLLELLLSTTLSARQIVEGQWSAVVRMFARPVALFVAIYFVGNLVANQSSPGANFIASLATAAAAASVIPFDLAALIWFGMWMGLISKKANAAAWKTVFFAMVIPSIIVAAAFGLIQFFMLGLPGKDWADFINTAIPVAGSIAIDWWLYRFARRKLFAELRQRAVAV